MSYREKSSWIALLLYLGIYGWYAWTLAKVIAAGQTETFDYWGELVSLIVVLVIATIILESIVAAKSPKEAQARRDERERLIHFKAANVGYGVAMVGAVGVIWAIATGKPSFYTANGLFFTMVLAETARHATQIFFFHRGA